MDFDINKLIAQAKEAVSIEERWETIGPEDGIPEAIITVGNDGRVTLAKDVTDWLAARQPRPRSRTGTAILTELESFIAHVRRHRGAESAVFADTVNFSLTAVFDYNEPGRPSDQVEERVVEHDAGTANASKEAYPEVLAAARAGWMRHRAVYACPRSREWKEWTAKDGVDLTQEQFGDHLERNLDDITSEEGFALPGHLMDMARNLQIYTTGTFEKRIDPTNGTSQMVCKDEHSPSSTRIPKSFALAIPVFDAGEKYLVEARIRFQLAGGRPRFAYHLHNRGKVETDAFGGVRRKVRTETDLPLFAGSPE